MELRQQIARLADAMSRADPACLIDPESLVKHHYADGAYIREMVIPAGVTVAGAIHKTKHAWVFLKGEMLVAGESKPIVAPVFGVSPPGTQRAVYALTECTFLAFHATDKTDPGTIRSLVLAKDEGDLLAHTASSALEHAV